MNFQGRESPYDSPALTNLGRLDEPATCAGDSSSFHREFAAIRHESDNVSNTMRKSTITAALVLASSSTSFGQSLNEIYVSHTGNDNMEYIEVIGTGNASLDGFMLLVVEGDSSGAGFLDRAIDLSGNTIPADGYFVAGNTAVANLDLDIGTDNILENGSDTFYLISTTDVSGVTALLGTDLDTNEDQVTVLAGMGSVTIIDVVGLVDNGYPVSDQVFDGATVVGPDGASIPPGIFRGDDAPNGWCLSNFLDFGLGTDRTPGAMNGSCSIPTIGTDYCFGDGSGTACPCGNTGGTGLGCANSSTNGAEITGSGSLSIAAGDLVLTGTGAPGGVSGIFFAGTTQITGGNGNPFGDGLRCVGGPVTRIQTVIANGAGTAVSSINVAARVGATVGSTNTIQYWYRDTTGPCGNLFNFSHGLEITWAN